MNNINSNNIEKIKNTLEKSVITVDKSTRIVDKPDNASNKPEHASNKPDRGIVDNPELTDDKIDCVDNTDDNRESKVNNKDNKVRSDTIEGNIDTIKKEDIKKLVLSGGGLLGISYIGLFKYLEEHNINKQITSLIGCSAGAMFGTFFTIGYSSSELQSLIMQLNFKDYINITAESILNFMKLKGLESGKNIMNFIKHTIRHKTNDENITFIQIYDKFKIDLKIGVTNLTTSKFEICDMKNTPNLPIYQAINASIAIPFIFEPVVINNNIYCDGGILDNLPLDYIIDIDNLMTSEFKNPTNAQSSITTNVKDTLGIYLLNKFITITFENIHQLSLSHYFNALMHSFCRNYITTKINDKNIKHKHTIIIYEIPYDIMTFLKLNATHTDINNIINIAYLITKKTLSI